MWQHWQLTYMPDISTVKASGETQVYFLLLNIETKKYVVLTASEMKQIRSPNQRIAAALQFLDLKRQDAYQMYKKLESFIRGGESLS